MLYNDQRDQSCLTFCSTVSLPARLSRQWLDDTSLLASLTNETSASSSFWRQQNCSKGAGLIIVSSSSQLSSLRELFGGVAPAAGARTLSENQKLER